MFINTIIGIGLFITGILLGPMKYQLGTSIGGILSGATGGIGIAVIALSLLGGGEIMERIKKLTPEQEAKIPEFINKWVDKASEPIDIDKCNKAVKNIYKDMGQKEPIAIHGRSPLETSYLAWLYLINHNTDNQLYSQLRNQLGSQLSSQLGSQLDSQLRNQLGSQLGSQLYGQLDNQLGSQLGSQLYGQLRSQLRSQLDNQLGSQLRNQLYSQLDSQLYSQLGSQLYGQLRSQLHGQLDNQLGSQLDSQLHGQLGSQLSSQLRDQLGSQLGSQLYGQLRSQLRSQLDNQLGSQLSNQLSSQLRNQLGSQLDSQLHGQLGSQLDSLTSDQQNDLMKELLPHLKEQLQLIQSCFYVTTWWSAWAGFMSSEITLASNMISRNIICLKIFVSKYILLFHSRVFVLFQTSLELSTGMIKDNYIARRTKLLSTKILMVGLV